MGLLSLGILLGPQALAKPNCRSTGELYTLENMNIPACDESKSNIDLFKRGSQPNAGSEAAPGPSSSGGSFGSGSGRSGFDQPSSNRAPASAGGTTVVPTGPPTGDGSQSVGPGSTPPDSGSSPNNTLNDSGGDARWIK